MGHISYPWIFSINTGIIFTGVLYYSQYQNRTSNLVFSQQIATITVTRVRKTKSTMKNGGGQHFVEFYLFCRHFLQYFFFQKPSIQFALTIEYRTTHARNHEITNAKILN